MDAINLFVGWLFGDKTGVLFLVLGEFLLFWSPGRAAN